MASDRKAEARRDGEHGLRLAKVPVALRRFRTSANDSGRARALGICLRAMRCIRRKEPDGLRRTAKELGLQSIRVGREPSGMHPRYPSPAIAPTLARNHRPLAPIPLQFCDLDIAIFAFHLDPSMDLEAERSRSGELLVCILRCLLAVDPTSKGIPLA